MKKKKRQHAETCLPSLRKLIASATCTGVFMPPAVIALKRNGKCSSMNGVDSGGSLVETSKIKFPTDLVHLTYKKVMLLQRVKLPAFHNSSDSV